MSNVANTKPKAFGISCGIRLIINIQATHLGNCGYCLIMSHSLINIYCRETECTSDAYGYQNIVNPVIFMSH